MLTVKNLFSISNSRARAKANNFWSRKLARFSGKLRCCAKRETGHPEFRSDVSTNPVLTSPFSFLGTLFLGFSGIDGAICTFANRSLRKRSSIFTILRHCALWSIFIWSCCLTSVTEKHVNIHENRKHDSTNLSYHDNLENINPLSLHCTVDVKRCQQFGGQKVVCSPSFETLSRSGFPFHGCKTENARFLRNSLSDAWMVTSHGQRLTGSRGVNFTTDCCLFLNLQSPQARVKADLIFA